MTWEIPIKTAWMEDQSHHLPSMEYAKDIHRVATRFAKNHKDFTALEIGAAWGFSSLAILEAGAKYLLSVDSNALIKTPEEIEANGYKDKWAWNFLKSEKYWAENDETFDFIYIDGSHLYDDVKNDLYEGWKRVNPGGMMSADDWDHKNNNIVDLNGEFAKYGVSLACWEFWRDHPEIKKVGIEGRVLWFQK